MAATVNPGRPHIHSGPYPNSGLRNNGAPTPEGFSGFRCPTPLEGAADEREQRTR
jgi:hypothetical protein